MLIDLFSQNKNFLNQDKR